MDIYQFIHHPRQKAIIDHTCKTDYLVERMYDDDTEGHSLLSFDVESCVQGPAHSVGRSKSANENSDLPVSAEHISSKNAEKQVVNIVLYKQNKHRIVARSPTRKSIQVEYLSYYMLKPHTHSTFTFPAFEYDMQSQYDDPDIDGFKEECIRQIVRVFSMEQTALKNIHRIQFGYKGIVYHDTVVFAFFDMNKIEQYFRRTTNRANMGDNFQTKEPHVWAVVDEILQKGAIFSTTIDSRIISLFKQHPIVWDIKHDGQRITYPSVVYPVSIPDNTEDDDKKDDDDKIEDETNIEYVTDTYDSHHPTKTPIAGLQLLPYTYADIFADRYLFTFRPIPQNPIPRFNNGHVAYKRYVCFMYNPQTILSETIESHKPFIHKYPENFVENIDMSDENIAEGYSKIPCICFTQKIRHHRDTMFCGCLYPDLFDEVDPW